MQVLTDLGRLEHPEVLGSEEGYMQVSMDLG